jgi:Protein of unknown function (DUF4238)
MDKKRHHYVPKAYLNAFCDNRGKVLVYRKDDPSKAIPLSPDNTAFHKYYYSQPTPDGGVNHNALEDCFSKIEEKWPGIVDRLHRQENTNDSLQDVFQFMILQRVRVPASRDVVELILAEFFKAKMRELDAAGKLPPKPKGFKDILDHVEVSIDPHRSIHAIPQIIKRYGQVFNLMGFCALTNKTNVPFLTSDNPVIWFDPSVPDADLKPYVFRPGGPVMLLFPVSPSLVIVGDSSRRNEFAVNGLDMADLSDRQSVKAINRQVCRFSYEAVYAQKAGHEKLIQKYAARSPVPEFIRVSAEKGETPLFQMIFGKRERKPKWID